MANHNLPTQSSPYLNFVTELDGRFDDLCLGLDPARTTMTNLPTNSVGWSSAGNKWQRWTGSAWADLATTYNISIGGNAATAAALQTARTINGVSFNGTANINVPTQNSITFSNTGGAAAGTTFDGSTARTISHVTVGAPSVTGSGASGSWGISVTGTSANVTGTVAVANGGTGATTADAARTNLGLVIGTNIPSPTGAGATGTWNISVTGNAATATNATNAANADLLDGIDSTGFTRSTGTSQLGAFAYTSGNTSAGYSGGLALSNAGGGGGTASFIDFVLHNTVNAHVHAVDTGDGGCQLLFGTTPPGDPSTDRRVSYGRLRNDGVWEASGFLPTGGVGAVGTYAYLYINRAIAVGGTASASELLYSGTTGLRASGVAGTWRAMGVLSGAGSTVFLRIA